MLAHRIFSEALVFGTEQDSKPVETNDANGTARTPVPSKEEQIKALNRATGTASMMAPTNANIGAKAVTPMRVRNYTSVAAKPGKNFNSTRVVPTSIHGKTNSGIATLSNSNGVRSI